MLKDEVRKWLDERCGRVLNVETRVINDAAPPLRNEGSLSKQPSQTADASVYHVGSVSYNLADIPDDVDVRIQSEPPELLEMTFDGASGSITVLIKVVEPA
jgi:hypothetical protein